ncbi:MAG: LysR family transcriptional regulator, partial [Alphaproteobacteria bacterium]|nr:LysR family transcriptional regulator [Alphaproteobacteria bacterium]
MLKCMDRSSIKFDWNRARAFLVTAEEGSLSAAARALGMAQPTLGRQVSALEEELGVVLFERVGRGLTLTPSGEQLLEHVRKMGDAATAMSLKSFGQSQVIEGKVRLAVSEVFAAFTLPPILAKLRQIHAGIEIDVITSTQASDLLRREADIAIRYFHPKEPDLIAKKITNAAARLYATPEYLKKIGNPQLPYDLRNADFISTDNSGALLKGLNGMGLNLTEKNFPIYTPNWLVMWEYVKQ